MCVYAFMSLSLRRVCMCSLPTEFVCSYDCVPAALNWQVDCAVSIAWEGVCVCTHT